MVDKDLEMKLQCTGGANCKCQRKSSSMNIVEDNTTKASCKEKDNNDVTAAEIDRKEKDADAARKRKERSAKSGTDKDNINIRREEKIGVLNQAQKMKREEKIGVLNQAQTKTISIKREEKLLEKQGQRRERTKQGNQKDLSIMKKNGCG